METPDQKSATQPGLPDEWWKIPEMAAAVPEAPWAETLAGDNDQRSTQMVCDS